MFRRYLPVVCVAIGLACNATDAERPVQENPALSPTEGMPPVEAPSDGTAGGPPADPSSAPLDGTTPAAGGTPPAGTTPEQDPASATLDPSMTEPAGDPANENPAPEAAPSEDPATGPIDTTTRTFGPDDPNIQYSGRVDFSDPTAAVYASPGVSVTVRFRGNAISALLGDEFRYGSERGFHDVIVDGLVVGQVALEPGVDRYQLASGLTLGQHTVSLVKRTQAMLGKSLFRGFEIDGELVAPPERPALAIEFIGDSITAGEGADAVNGSSDCKQNAFGMVTDAGWGQPFHNADASYAVVTARALGAEYHLTAVSGIGLVRNYSTADTQTMPVVYDRTFVEEPASPVFDHTRFIPDIVVIALGTNDFSGGDAPAGNPRPNLDVGTYLNAYAEFVSRVRADFPNAEIFALTSQLLGGAAASDLRSAVTGAVQRANANGDARVHSFVTAQVAGQGCTGHPNAEQHAELARALTAEIRSVLGLP